MQVEVNNFRMGYDERGSGIPLVFVHGYPLDRRIWQRQVEGLSGSARVLAPDLRGHGESQVMPGPYWMDVHASDLSAFLDALGITEPVVMCGLSMGGYIAMAFYRDYGIRLAGLILTATRSGADTAEGKANRDQAAELARKEGAQAITESMLPKILSPNTYDQKPELVESIRQIMNGMPVEAITGDLLGMRERPDSGNTLEQIDLPALILHGADDQIIPTGEAERMHERLSNSSLEIIPDAGHLLNMEQPELFNQAVRRFLESIPYHPSV